VTPLILEILSNMEWWAQYSVSPHPRDMTYFTLLLVKRSAAPSLQENSFKHREFGNSVMGEYMSVSWDPCYRLRRAYICFSAPVIVVPSTPRFLFPGVIFW
jgi:hypothetical protein